MLSDVAGSDRTEQRIDQRMDRHVGVAMPGETVAMCDLHSAQPQLLALRKLVHIKAGAHPDRRHRGCKIMAIRQLMHGFVPFDESDRAAPGLRNLRIIPGGWRPVPKAVRVQNSAKIECLRGLHPPQTLTPGTGTHHGVMLAGLAMGQAIYHGQHRYRASVVIQRQQQSIYHFVRDNGPGCIVDQHPFGHRSGKHLQAQAHRFLARFTTSGEVEPLNARQRLACDRPGIGRNHHGDRSHARIRQRFDRMAQDRLSTPDCELFGQRLPGP